MTPTKIISVAQLYQSQFAAQQIQPQRMDLDRTFGSLSQAEVVAHAAYLSPNIIEYATAGRIGKANRHLTAVQMLLGFADWYTLRELMDHNRP